MNRAVAAIATGALVLSCAPALAQSADHRFQIAGQVALVGSSELDTTDIGIGARFSWHPTRLVGFEAEMTVYPDDIGEGPAPFSRRRVEGLFGITAGAALDRVRPFAKLRPGFLAFQDAPEPFPCILIFPPPLSCALAAGRTVFALDAGGGLEVFPTARTFVRVDAGDRMVRYPGPAIDRNGMARDDAFFSHDFRFSLGAGVRF